MYVYLLSSYDEYGAEHVQATLDRNSLMDLLKKRLEWKLPASWEGYPKKVPLKNAYRKVAAGGLKQLEPIDFEEVTEETVAAAKARWEEICKEDFDGLEKLLAKPDEELADRDSGHDLASGWGGVQLHVVKLL